MGYYVSSQSTRYSVVIMWAFGLYFAERRKVERQEQGAARRRDWQERYASRSSRTGRNAPPSTSASSTSSSNIVARADVSNDVTNGAPRLVTEYGSNSSEQTVVTSPTHVQVLEPEATSPHQDGNVVSRRLRGLFQRKAAKPDVETPAVAASGTHLQAPGASGDVAPVYSVSADGTSYVFFSSFHLNFRFGNHFFYLVACHVCHNWVGGDAWFFRFDIIFLFASNIQNGALIENFFF